MFPLIAIFATITFFSYSHRKFVNDAVIRPFPKAFLFSHPLVPVLNRPLERPVYLPVLAVNHAVVMSAYDSVPLLRYGFPFPPYRLDDWRVSAKRARV